MPVEYDSTDEKYRIAQDYFLQPTNLTLQEALAVVLLAGRTGEANRDPVISAATTAAMKIEAGLPAPMQDELREVAETVDYQPPPTNPLVEKGQVYQTLLQASRSRRVVEIEYDCLTEFRKYDAELHPYQLLFRERSWYVIGFSVRHDEVRTFNLGRIRTIKLLDKPFERPASFSLKKHLRNAWRLIADEGPDSRVHLHFSAVVARNVSEVLWHPTQQAEFRDDGSLDYYVEVSGLREIIWWILGYGDQVEVLEPAKLRTMVARRLKTAADRYGDDAL